MQDNSFEAAIELIEAKDARYHREAYVFVREALDHTQLSLAKQNRRRPRHVTGQELQEGIREYGLSQFGPMTLTLLNEWGVHRCADFGEIVFNLVDSGLLAKTEKDSREDFSPGYDFFEAFRLPFLPASRRQPELVRASSTRS